MIKLGDQVHHNSDKRLFAFSLAFQPSDTITYSANIVKLVFPISYGMGIDVKKMHQIAGNRKMYENRKSTCFS